MSSLVASSGGIVYSSMCFNALIAISQVMVIFVTPSGMVTSCGYSGSGLLGCPWPGVCAPTMYTCIGGYDWAIDCASPDLELLLESKIDATWNTPQSLHNSSRDESNFVAATFVDVGAVGLLLV